MTESILISNDNSIQVECQDPRTLAYINNATVTCTLKDANGVNVVGQSWPLTLVYVSGSNGLYRGILEEELVLVGQAPYFAHIDVDAGSDVKGFKKLLCIAKENN